jgi:hypothetical protein
MNAEMQLDFPVQPLRPGQLAGPAQAHLSWLWHGFLARGRVTALVGSSKSGKTTLLSLLLARSGEGGQLAGLQLAPIRSFIVTEEQAADWDDRCLRLAIGQNVQFLCRPFHGVRPTEAQWFSLVANLEKLHRREGLDLVVIDALATLLPGYAETCAPKLLDCLLPLQALANLGTAVWLMHHPAKGKCADGQAGRGSGALGGFADILMEMKCCRRAGSRDRRRRIHSYSRYVQTPRHLIIELNPDGSDYLLRTDEAGTPLVQTWAEVEYILTRATEKLSIQTILERWPVDGDPPDGSTLWRWLKRATQQGIICRSGSGYRGDCFRYWLPGHEPLLWPGNNSSEEEKEAWRERRREHLLRLDHGRAGK